jgi:hypothetical protein
MRAHENAVFRAKRGSSCASARIVGSVALFGFALLACGGNYEKEPGDGAAANAGAGGGGTAGAAPRAAAGNAQGASSGSNGDYPGPGVYAQPACQDGDQVYPWGSTFTGHDGCSTCRCNQDIISCDASTCKPCSYGGVSYRSGDAFGARDGCNQCTCNGKDGSASCSTAVCACNPKAEWWRDYRGVTPEACTGVVCPAVTAPFSSACGCGCEEALSCPQTCYPSGTPACDEATRELCPYLAIAD